MAVICIQIHPNRAPNLHLATVREIASAVGRTALFIGYSERKGFEQDPYFSLWFETPFPSQAWAVIWSELYQNPQFGASLKISSIAMCEGEHGWDDYLLLHHFDPAMPLDNI